MSGKISHGGQGFSLAQLSDYNSWAEQSPRQIWEAVIEHGGWAKVFPKELPTWASRVRNYFNETPVYLAPLQTHVAYAYVRKIRDDAPIDDVISKDGAATAFALTDAVYTDGSYRWFLMHHGSTVYHKGDGKGGSVSKTVVMGQRNTVFKLVSPDFTGGSLEVIVKNPDRSGKLGGKPGEAFVADADFDAVTRGSYNYAETVVSGFAEHKRMDVDPHVANESFYINPPKFSKMSDRKFPRKIPKY